jgi:biotin operon repressor
MGLAYLLATHIRQNDQFQIQVWRLAEQTGLSESSVKRGVDELEAAGIISRQRRGRRSATLYTWVMVCPIGCEKTHHRSGKADASGNWVPTATNGAASHEVKATLNSGLDHPVESEWCQPDLSSGVSLTSLINNKDFSEIDKNLFLSVDNEEDLLELEAFTVQAIDAALVELLASAEASVDHEAELELIRHPSHRLGMAQAAIALWFDKCSNKTARSWGRYLSRCISNDPTAISCEYDGELASSLYSAISSWNKEATGYLWRDLSQEKKDSFLYLQQTAAPLTDEDTPQPAQEYLAESEPLPGVSEANKRWLGNRTSAHALSYVDAANELEVVIPPGIDIVGAGELVVSERKRRKDLLEEELLSVEEAKA